MPKAIAQETQVSSGEVGHEVFPVRLGIQVGAVAYSRPGQLASVADTYLGARLFSRFALLDRIYLIPSLGFYRLANAPQLGLGAPNLVEAAVQLHLALLRLGPVAIMAGLNQKVGMEFWADAQGVRGNWMYRLGPGVNVNLRLSPSWSILVGADYAFGLNSILLPQWSGHAGLLIAL